MSTIPRPMRKLSKPRPQQRESAASSANTTPPRMGAFVDQCGSRSSSPPDSLCDGNEWGGTSAPPLNGHKTFSWPTGDPENPCGFLTFTFSPPPSPPLSPTRDACSSPTQSIRRSGSPTKRDSKAFSVIADWFQGESAPISLGVVPSTTCKGQCEAGQTGPVIGSEQWMAWRKHVPTLTSRPGSPAKSPQARTSPKPSRFSLLGSYLNLGKSATSSPATPARGEVDDPLLRMDIRKALQQDEASDYLSSASVHDVMQKAEDLLRQLQMAYHEQVLAAKETQLELAAQREEAEEAGMRVEHLKHQLDELSKKTVEQDTLIAELVQKLAEKKLARQADDEACICTVRLVDDATNALDEMPGSCQSSSSTVSDPGFESDNESLSTEESTDGNSSYSDTLASSNTSICSSPRIDCARRTSVTRVSPSIVHNNSIRSPKRSAIATNDQRCEDGMGIDSSEGSGVDKVCISGSSQDANTACEVTGHLGDDNTIIKERNKFLEEELDAVGQMIDMLLMQVPANVCSAEPSPSQGDHE